MKLGFYYHIVVYKDSEGRIYLPSYLGLFVDELAKNVRQLYYFAYTTTSLTFEQNYKLKQTNIILKNLGKKRSFAFTVIFGYCLLKRHREIVKNCDKILVRAPSPLAPWFYLTFKQKTKIHYLMVGDYMEGIKHQEFGFLKQSAINIFTFINEYFQNVAIKKSGCMVNSVPLKEKYNKINDNVAIVKTTTLTKENFYFREDTCKDPDNIKLLFVGRIEKAKGMDELIAAFKLLRDNNYPVTLHLAGWNTNEARHYFELLNSDSVTAKAWIYHGLLGGKDLFNLYRSSDIFVLPSHHEGFPRVIWEAMANSLPVISTNVGSIPFYIKNGHDAILIEAGDKRALYDSIVELIENTALMKKIIDNSYKLVSDYTLDKQVKILVDHLNL
jgi:glycosyltransferase involved in cell wall biosynthesis